MNHKQLILMCLAASAYSFAQVQSKSVAIGDDAEQAPPDSVGNKIDGPEEGPEVSSQTTVAVEGAEEAATRAPASYIGSVTKALEVLKASFEQDLKFDTVKKARRFVKYGRLLPSYLARLEADQATGNQSEQNKALIAEMRKVMEEPRFKVAERVSRKTMNKYRPLDLDLYKRDKEAKFSRSRYLQSLNLLASLKNKMAKDESVKRILEHVYELKRPGSVASLLEHAVEDTRATLRRSEEATAAADEGEAASATSGERVGCQIEILHPVCDLTGTPKNSAQVPVAAELEKLKELSASQLEERLKEAKVERELMSDLCTGVRRRFKNIALIQKYQKAGVFESESELADRLKADAELNSYYQLYDLCAPSRMW